MQIPAWTQTTLPTHELSELREKLPEGDDWRYEVKWDGYRAFLIAQGEDIAFISRNGNNLGELPLAQSLAHEIGVTAILDGELVVLDDNGRSNFGLLRVLLGKNSPRVRFVAFDILRLEEMDLRGLELRSRLEFLESALAGKTSDRLMLSPQIPGNAQTVIDNAYRVGLEGIVAKSLSSSYTGRRSPDWLKVKCRIEDKGIVIGYTLLAGREASMGALVIGEERGGKMHHIGRVGTGFKADDRKAWFRRLEAIQIDGPEVEGLTTSDKKGVRWVRPDIHVRFEVAERTLAGTLRQASFKGEIPL